MDVWIIIAAVLMIIGTDQSVVESRAKKKACFTPILYAIKALFVEAGIFGLCEVIPWIMSQESVMVVKISFIILLICIIVCFASLLFSNSYYSDLSLTICAISVIVLIVCAITCITFLLIKDWWKALIIELIVLVTCVYSTPIRTGKR